jgi:SOS-response transcriptional repressor LexA
MTGVFTLTRQQKQLFDFLQGYIDRTGGIAPSLEEMTTALGLRSKSNIHRLLGTLTERGYIRRLPHTSRAIEIVRRFHSCPSCDTDIQPAFNFCPGCGRPLRQELARAAA